MQKRYWTALLCFLIFIYSQVKINSQYKPTENLRTSLFDAFFYTFVLICFVFFGTPKTCMLLHVSVIYSPSCSFEKNKKRGSYFLCNCSYKWVMPWTTWRSYFASAEGMDRSSPWMDHFAWRVSNLCLGKTVTFKITQESLLFHLIHVLWDTFGHIVFAYLQEADRSCILSLPCGAALWESVIRRSGVPSSWACRGGWRGGAHGPSSQYGYFAGFEYHDWSWM